MIRFAMVLSCVFPRLRQRAKRTLTSIVVLALVGFVLSWIGSPQTAGADQTAPDYSKQIAPLFKKYCGGCHNADDKEGDLSLESYAQLQKGGENGPAVLPGDSKSSRMIRLLTGAAEPKMPPEDNQAPTAEEIELLKTWVDAGAKGPQGAEPDRTLLITPQIQPAKVKKPVTAVAWSPRGDLLAIARFEEIELQNAKTRKHVRSIGGLPGKVTSVEFSRDGRLLVAATGVAGLYGKAMIYSADSGEVVAEFQGHRDILYDAALSPDGKLLATAGYDRKIILWEIKTRKPLRTMAGHNDAVYDLAFSPDGCVLASASGDETAKLWQVSTGMRLDTLGQPEAEQYVVAFSPNGRYVLAGGADNRIRVWRFVSKTRQRINPMVYARFAHEGPIVQIAFSQDGKSFVSLAEDRTMKLWETTRFSELYAFDQQPDVAPAAALSPEGETLLVGRMDGSLASYPIIDVTREAGPQTVAATTPHVGKTTPMTSAAEQEPNDTPAQATPIQAPATARGVIHVASAQKINTVNNDDVDLFRFSSTAGRQWIIETKAARNKSPLDSQIEVLDSKGQPIVRVLLQAVRDSYFTFRGKDSNTSDDFRVHNWQEMELNEYLYANGEVVKLWLYPRGPDSGFKVYPGAGNRYTYFDTPALSHPLHQPCYIVKPHPPSMELIANGLPVFPVYYQNDDDSRRKLGNDSRLLFTAPADGEYLVRVSDVRGFEGPDFKYELTVRPRRPNFKVTLRGANPSVGAGSGKEFTVRAERLDYFEGPIRVDIENVPPGFSVTTPLIIEAEQNEAVGTITARSDAPKPTTENAKLSKVKASAEIDGKTVTKQVNNLGEIKLGKKPKLLARVLPLESKGPQPPSPQPTAEHPLELTLAPGQTIRAVVRIQRNGFKGRVSFGTAESGRNLSHGVYVDNIGLNGLLIVEGQQEREFFITAAKWVPETTRTFHLKAAVEGGQTTLPVILHVRR